MGEPTVEYRAHDDTYLFVYQTPHGPFKALVMPGRGRDDETTAGAARRHADRMLRDALAEREGG